MASYLSRLCTYPNYLNRFSLRNSAIWYICASFQMSTFLTLSSFVFPLAHLSSQHAHFSCEQFPLLLLSTCPTFCTIGPHYGRFYSRLVHFVFQLCWYVPAAHHPGEFPTTLTRQSLLCCSHLSRLLRWHRTLSPDT